MEEKKPSEMTDQELLAEAKKLRSFNLINSYLIGFLIGIVIYSIVMRSFGFLMIIPLYMIYKFANASKTKRNDEINKLIKERNLN